MTARYTPGPWNVIKMDNGYGFQIINEKGNRVMGSIASNGAGIMGQSAIAKANAKLIAAAPDMAEALLAALQAIKIYPDQAHPMTASEVVFRLALRKAGIEW